MREASKDPKRLQDILEAIDNIFQYTGDDDMITVTSDKMRYHAIVYNMMMGVATLAVLWQTIASLIRAADI